MALNIPWSMFRNDGSGPVFVAGFVLGSLACLMCRFAIGFAHHLRKHGLQDEKALNVDAAEKGGLEMGRRISLDEDLFSLEKRAFFNQSWLFACHRSRFTKAGDYHTFSIAGKPFFVVLGSDSQLRAFHNVCRHRAYTVVRRAQGSSLRFSCKYHGWQYDSLGKLVKAPQFENTVGFNMQNNSLYEVALRIDEDGFIFVNFANGAASPPVWTTSLKNYGGALYWESFEIKTNFNWRIAAQHLEKCSGKAEKTTLGIPCRLLSFRSDARDRPLGPLAMLQYIDRDSWCTLSLLPESSSNSTIRFDIYQTGTSRKNAIRDFKSQMHQYWARLEDTHAEGLQIERSCIRKGSKLDEIDNLILDHRQQEQRAGKTIDPASKDQSGSGEQDAVMLCRALEGPNGIRNGCPKQQELGLKLDW